MRVFFAFIASLLLFISGFYLGLMLSFPLESEQHAMSSDNTTEISYSGGIGSTITVPAVNQNGQGISTKVYVSAQNGTGRALVDINQLIFWGDTQESIQTARDVASTVTGVDTSKIDLTYSISTQASIIEGQSAGAALTIATVAALTNTTVDGSTIITGTINDDGIIGPVGGIVEKAQASKDAGATTFLVPTGQSIIKETKPATVCRDIGGFEWCTVKYMENTKNVQDVVGIQVVEVSTIYDALEHYNIKLIK